MKLLLCLGFVLLFAPKAYAYTETDCINAIIGEAESESFEGKVAIGETIRNRHSLKGVYGLRSQRVLNHRYSQKTLLEAQKAWALSCHSHLTKGAIGWGNKKDLEVFKTKHWFKSCFVIARIGNHFFYKARTNENHS